MKTLIASLSLVIIASPAFAAGDPAAGEVDFRKCKSCHSIIAPDGTAIQKGGATGPNLYGVIGRQIGTFPGFDYSDFTKAAGADGTVWDAAKIVAYLPDPSAWLQQKTGNASAHSKMAFKLKDGAEDVAAYLASIK